MFHGFGKRPVGSDDCLCFFGTEDGEFLTTIGVVSFESLMVGFGEVIEGKRIAQPEKSGRLAQGRCFWHLRGPF